jgi:hypothetical protein
MMEAVRTSETSVYYHFTRQYIPEDNSEHHIQIQSTNSHISPATTLILFSLLLLISLSFKIIIRFENL